MSTFTGQLLVASALKVEQPTEQSAEELRLTAGKHLHGERNAYQLCLRMLVALSA